jgi:endonuclease YncB( thermonuclease family)
MKEANGHRFYSACLMSSAVLLFAITTTGVAEESEEEKISGTAVVIDADILRIGDQRVILWGIDAPEPPQTCIRDDKVWSCHDAAQRLLETIVGRAEVTCILHGKADPLNRRYGVCMSGGDDVNEIMVRNGMALAYSEQTDTYEAAQLDAITEGAGLWANGTHFLEPWLWRQENNPGSLR